MQPGNEPPLHLHEERDAVFYVLEGEMGQLDNLSRRDLRTQPGVLTPGHQLRDGPP